MKHETVRASAFAMPLTNPAFPAGPYRYEFGLSAMRALAERTRRHPPHAGRSMRK